MTDLDRLDELVVELFKFTLHMDTQEMNERLQEISEAVIAKRLKKDQLWEQFSQFLILLENEGIAQEHLVHHYMQCAGHGARWPEVQALGREMFAAKHPNLIPMQNQQAGAPIIPQAPPSPNINTMVNPLLPNPNLNMPPAMAGHTPCLVTKMDNGQIFMTPMQPSPSPIGPVVSPMLPLMTPSPNTGMAMNLPGMPMNLPGMTLQDDVIPDLPELGFVRSKSMPQTSLKINVLEDSIKPPVPWNMDMMNGGAVAGPNGVVTPGLVGPMNGIPMMPMPMIVPPTRSRSRSRDDHDQPLPVGPYDQSRSPSRERERPPCHEPDLMNVPLMVMPNGRSNSVPMPTLKGNRSSRTSSSRRRRRNKQPTKRELSEAKLKELARRYGERFTTTGMRGKEVLRLKAKTKRALENIVPFINFLDERVSLMEVSCPKSNPAKDNVRGFLAYIRTQTEEEAKHVHDDLFPEYCAAHTKDGASPFKLIELNPMAKAAKQAAAEQAARDKAETNTPQTPI